MNTLSLLSPSLQPFSPRQLWNSVIGCVQRKCLWRPALALGICLTLVVAANAESRGSKRPNIVVILCDDLGYGDLECYGHPHIKTPRLNALAESGIRLTSCYSAAPVCSPSRVGLLTGRSPNRAGVYDWIPPGNKARPDARDQVHMRAEEVTIAKLLKQSGYATCMSGKWHCNSRFNSSKQPQPGDAGFDHWFGTQNNASPSHENPKNYVRNGEEVGALEGFSCQLAADEAIGWIRKQQQADQDKPFFVYLAFHEPHEPVASPAALVDQYRSVAKNEDEAQYFANVANVDSAVGKVIDSLSELGVRDETLVIFTSDNGPETLKRYARARRSWGRATPLRGMKLWTTEAGFRVAGIMSWPGAIASGQVSDEVVSSLDFLPTFCNLAGSEPPKDLLLDGTTIESLFDGESVARSKPLLWSYYNALNQQKVAMRTGPWKMLASLNGGDFKNQSNVYDGNREAILSAELTDFELYRVTEDISESENVIHSASVADELKRQMREQYRELAETSHYWQAGSTQ